ncbi:hypothetical protein PMAYCL1PPCAC_11033, partial [Pristionchus mayeri]
LEKKKRRNSGRNCEQRLRRRVREQRKRNARQSERRRLQLVRRRSGSDTVMKRNHVLANERTQRSKKRVEFRVKWQERGKRRRRNEIMPSNRERIDRRQEKVEVDPAQLHSMMSTNNQPFSDRINVLLFFLHPLMSLRTN